ncbi:hypothetical protein GCK72_001623 [Caenorhabditis remanei]|uniref:Decapping nuclease n=1 Tax=Caenorhabditis remanei TaxID=31234 RepID=A0A6A5HSU0_CAERE|nr:hypothetical protein GCK72_001623 [Caenorhabditis remanei]KAF1769806.1 hypothetical protein GCK72_001623 [Caenorhabditis remanei]
MDTKIRIENVDYYLRDANLNATPVSDCGIYPKELNGYMEYLEHSIRKLPLCKLNIKLPILKSKELKMESLIDYINQKGWVGGVVPDFVTTKDLLKSVASLETHLIHVCRVGGVFFVLKVDKEDPIKSSHKVIFNHFMTKKSGNDVVMNDGSAYKGVFNATILNGEKKMFNILYSGEVDAVKRTPNGNLRHYEMDVTYGGPENDFFWIENSCRLFWKSFFGGSPTLIIGSRTGETAYKKSRFLTYPKHSVYEIKQIIRDEMPSEVSFPDRRPLWTVSDGKKNLHNFLQLVKTNVKRSGDCYVFSRVPGSLKWNFKRDDVAIAEFRDLIRKNIPSI